MNKELYIKENWEKSVMIYRKHKRGEEITPEEIAVLKSIDLDVFAMMYPQDAEWIKSL